MPWLLPGAVLLGLLTVFVAATRPTELTPTTTTAAPPIAAIEPENLDFRTVPENDGNLSWELVPFDDSAEVNDLVYEDGLYLAGGASDAGATVWWSRGGSMWNPAITIYRPDGPTSIEEIVAWNGGFVALGGAGLDNRQVGIWTSDHPAQTWDYHGILNPDAGQLVGLAAGSQLFAVTEDESGYAGWTSTNGLDWEHVGPLAGLTPGSASGLVGVDDTYYVFGLSTTEQGVFQAMYRLENGALSFQVASFDEPGTITDVTVDGDHLMAVGHVPVESAGGYSLEPALWESPDGVSWRRLLLDTAAFSARDVSLTVTSTAPGNNPTAELRLSGTTVTVTEGTTLQTDFGSVVVEEIIDAGVEVRGLNYSNLLPTGVPRELPTTLLAQRIAVDGSRIVITGAMDGFAAPQTIVWASGDGGATWSREILPATSSSYHITTNGGVVAMLASGGDITQAWRATWDTTLVEEAGIALIEAYVGAINTGDTDLMLSLLPAESPGTPLDLPSLGNTDPGWWDDAGNLDRNRVTETMGYLTNLNTSVSIDECSASAALSTTNRVDAVCLYTVNSDLLSALGLTDGRGRADVRVSGGVLAGVSVHPVGSETVWQQLATLLADADELVITTTSAVDHVAAAREYVSRLLQPGETKTVETLLGTMEWSWLEPEEFQSVLGPSITWSPLGYVLTGSLRTPSGPFEPVVYLSGDGLDWEQTELPDYIDEIWGVSAFGDGALANVRSAPDTDALVYFDGSDWTPIPFPVEGSVDYYDPAVVGDDLALVLAWELSEVSQDAVLLSVGPDLKVTEASLPPLPDPGSSLRWIEIVAGDDGFAAFATDGLTGSVSVWTTDDGQEWVLLTETITLNNAQYISNPRHHAGRYFVVGPGVELQCTDTALGEECAFWSTTTWTSSDGAVWRQLTTESGGPVLATGITSGPFGLAAFGALDTGRPAWVYLSADGELWHEVEEIALLGDVDRWWWNSTPAVGENSIIAVGGSARENITLDPDSYDMSDESFFMIVGRLVE